MKKMKLVSKLGISLIILLAVVLSVSALVRYLILDPASTNATLIEQGMDLYDFHFKPWNYVLILHIITASLALIIGPFQFFKKLRIKKKAFHRNLGKVYISSIFISGLTGIYLSIYAFGGVVSKLGFFCLSIVWIVTTFLAYKSIRNKELIKHEWWMYRSYAVTFVAVTFRFWSAAIGYSFDNFQLGYTAAIWVSLIGNLVVIEYWLRKKGIQKRDIPSQIAK
jgi:uncharacterized membrane protein